jgi:hypothetical protein
MYTFTTKEVVVVENSHSSLWVLRDSEQRGVYDVEMLEKYFDDLYHLFLSKFTKLSSTTITAADSNTLARLLQEILKIKQLLQKE